MAADIAVPNGNPGKPRKAVPKSAQKSSVDPNVLEVVFGSLLIKPWYPSFYPEELVGRRVERLYVCHWCFKYNKEIVKFLGHMKVCALKNAPPGSLVYSKDGYSLYEIDGEESKLYAQSLSLFAKLFLDTKSVFYDVTTFLYYLLVAHEPNPAIPEMDFGSSTAQSSNITTGEAGGGGSAAGTEMVPGQVVGFFSKEKMSWDNNNLACILVFPPWQKHGLGQFLMAASYELGKREGRLGGPEKPLSELGRLGYMRYWSSTLARTILSHPARKTLTIADLRDETYITPEDIIMTLQAMDVLEHKKRGGADAVINKAKVREWVANHKVNLESRVDPEAFVVRNESEGSESE